MDRRQRIAKAIASRAPCSAALHTELYVELVVREADRTPQALPYYTQDPSLSTCALAALGALRLAGCVEPECVAPYVSGRVGRAVEDVQALARRFGAWVTSSPPVPPMQCGDVWIIADAQGGNAHVGVCTADAVLKGDTMTVETAEGGQGDGKGWTAVGTFTRQWHLVGNRWMLGSRYLLGYASADRMPVPDTIDDAPAPAA